MKKLFLSSLIYLLLSHCFQLRSQYVFDQADFLSEQEASNLDRQIKLIDDETSVQIALYTIDSLGDKSIKEYCLSLAEELGVGQKGVNNGILIVLSKKERKTRIENGYGLEWCLDDKKSQIIINQMISYFKKGEFANGLKSTVDTMQKEVKKYDWEVVSYFDQIASKKDEGKIIKFHYTNKTGNQEFNKAREDSPQFSEDFKIALSLNHQEYQLFYTKYMNGFLEKILSGEVVTIYARLVNWKEKKFELMGVE